MAIRKHMEEIFTIKRSLYLKMCLFVSLMMKSWRFALRWRVEDH